jgi:prepilin-type N-terminal cleavage/methylation domain-containing protein
VRPERARRRRQGGFTLIELLITIIVASVVASTTFAFFAGQQHIYETQTKLLNVQQNLWMAMEVIARSARASGGGAFSGCTSGIRAYRAGTGLTTLAAFTITNGAAGAPDSLTLGNFSGGSGNFVDTMLNATMDTNYPGSAVHTTDHKPFREGEFILVLDTRANPPGPPAGDRGCTLYQITNVPGNSDNLVTNPTSDWNGNGPVPGLIPFDYTAGSFGIRNVGTINSSVRYFIDSTGAPATPPRLMVDDLLDTAAPQVLAEGIEDLQVSYACDRLPAGAPDGALTEGTDATSRLADEWVYNQSGDVVPAGCTTPTAIRITLIGRSLTEDFNLFGTAGSGSVSSSFKPAVEDGVAGAGDNFRHRVLTTTVYPRN